MALTIEKNLMSRPVIRQLNQTLINQIAAGEVIERPAAALKELVENAIDAKAKHISVVLRDGGKSLIQVTDDGVGMTGDDLKIALQRHATSKLPEFDLFNITTLGFRGEALPSIGSVSRLQIISNPKNSDQHTAMEITVEGGVISEPKVVAYAAKGTRITIKDLFYATPARLKFLKTDASETTACIEILKRLALCYPHIAFSCQVEERTVFSYKAKAQLQDRIEDVLSDKACENLRAFAAERDGMVVHGLVSLPTFHKSQANDQYFFVNNRPVRDKLFLGVLKAAYQDFIERGRHPVVAIFVQIDPREVDVNVHPTKAEVRFRPEQSLRSLLIGIIRATLTEHGQVATPALSDHMMRRFQAVQTQPQERILEERIIEKTLPFAQFSPSRSAASYGRGVNATSHFSKTNTAYGPAAMMKTLDQTLAFEHDMLSPQETSPLHEGEAGANSNVGFLGHALGQIAKSYIVSRTADGLMLIDQHAAHERVRYEGLKEAYMKDGVARQHILTPLMFKITAEQAELLKQQESHIKKLGFDLDIFQDHVLCRSYPVILQTALQGKDLEQTLTDLLDDLTAGDGTLALEDKLLHYLATHACHTSIRANDALNYQEMNHLLRQIEQTPKSATCNHGRPTYIALSLKDIESLFQRR